MDRNILFLCTGNSARSQMAEALLRKHAQDHFQAFSAGTQPEPVIFPPVVKVMQEVGIDLSSQEPKNITTYLGKVHFEKVIIVCNNAEKKCPVIFGPAQRLFWPFDDPAAVNGSEETVLQVCRSVRDQIEEHIYAWLKEQGVSS